MKLPMHASPLEAIRISAANLAAARHFWESAMGYRCTAETAVDDAILRKLWGAEGGPMWAVRMERAASTRIELYSWEGCTGQPIRDPRRPWDFGVAELQFQSSNPARALALIERYCEVLTDGVFLTPFGERCRFVSNSTGDECVVLSVPEIGAECDAFFEHFLGWHPRRHSQDAQAAIPGAASISLADLTRYASNGGGASSVEASRYIRLADPRGARDTADRMSPAYTGVWMLTASTAQTLPSDRAVAVEVPFIGRRRAIVTRAPGGVRFGVFERAAV